MGVPILSIEAIPKALSVWFVEDVQPFGLAQCKVSI